MEDMAKNDLTGFTTINPADFKYNHGATSSSLPAITFHHDHLNLNQKAFRIFRGQQYFRLGVTSDRSEIALVTTTPDDPRALKFTSNTVHNGYNGAYNSGLAHYLNHHVLGGMLYVDRWIRIYAKPENVSRDTIIFSLAQSDDNINNFVQKPKEDTGAVGESNRAEAE